MQAMTCQGVTEHRTYNNLYQLKGISGGEANVQYFYPTGKNNGKVCLAYDQAAGEEIQYTYDSLNRLSQAQAFTLGSVPTGCPAAGNAPSGAGAATRGQAYVYDGFGNLTQKNGIGGTGVYAPTLSRSVNGVTNQLVGASYDGNGNMTGDATLTGVGPLTYDVENRLSGMLVQATNATINYGYDAQNRRVGSYSSFGGAYTVYFYGAGGQRLQSYSVTVNGSSVSVGVVGSDVYFGGRRLAPVDRVGSARSLGGGNASYFPYGEDKGSNVGNVDGWGFGTYWKDSASGLSYAMNRYYSSGLGRFTSPDPAGSQTAHMNNSATFNRYSYSYNDPANLSDLSGLGPDCSGGAWTGEGFLAFQGPKCGESPGMATNEGPAAIIPGVVTSSTGQTDLPVFTSDSQPAYSFGAAVLAGIVGPPFANQLPGALDQETATMESLGVTPLSPGSPGFTSMAELGQGQVNWTVSVNGELMTTPAMEGITHAATAGGADVLGRAVRKLRREAARRSSSISRHRVGTI
jgi:RHS repeat-associated protein